MFTQHELEQTLRLLAEAEARIELQMQRLAELETARLKARAVLSEFEDTRLLIVNHRETLARFRKTATRRALPRFKCQRVEVPDTGAGCPRTGGDPA